MANRILPINVNLETDQDIIDWWDGLPNSERSGAVREAIRRAMGQVTTVEQVYAALLEIKQQLAVGQFVVEEGPEQAFVEPMEAARNLNNLMSMLEGL
ncbi:MAG TPA: hypothetical protein VGD99_04465 [Anaerolineae bacterium]